MSIFKKQPIVGGAIKYYGLEEWWSTTFSHQEQEHMESKYPGLVKGKVPTYSSLTKQDFLSVLATYFKLKEDAPIARRIRAKMVEIGENEPILKPGYYKGRHYSSYPADVLDLMREGNLDEAEELLYMLVEATESESVYDKTGVAPWYYDRLAVLYRKQKNLEKEYKILERFSKQKHGQGVQPPKLMERFEKVKQLLSEKRNS